MRRKGFSLPFILIITLLGIIVIVLVIYFQLKPNPSLHQSTEPIAQPTPSSTQATSPVQKEIRQRYENRINGDLYTHKGYGFSFRFPKEWAVDYDDLPELPIDPEHGGYGGTLKIVDVSKTEKLILAVRIDTAYGVAEADIEYNLSLTNDGSWKLTDRELVPPRSLKPGGITPHQDDGVTVIRAVKTIKSNQYWIDFEFKEGGKDYEPLFKQIIESFKFLD